MSTAYILARTKVRARLEALAAGFESLGYRISEKVPGAITAADALVIWNRYGAGDRIAARFDEIDAPVLVVENAYIPHPRGAETLALSRDHHLGAGWFPVGDRDRWRSWGVSPAPWQDRDPAAPVLLAPQRGIGPSGVAMPWGWGEVIAPQAAAATRRPIRLRVHPGRHAPARPLAEDFAEAGVVLTWASRVGIEALLAGVPVVALQPRWIAAAAAGSWLTDLDDPPRPPRLPVFERLAWAQFTLDELADGWPIARLLHRPA